MTRTSSATSAKITKYYMGLHFVLCHGSVDNLQQIRVADKDVLSSEMSTSLFIKKEDLFGGTAKEGGLAGVFELNRGLPINLASPYLTSVHGEQVPAYRGVTSLILWQIYIGLSYYMKDWKIACQRINYRHLGTAQWYPAKKSPRTRDINAVHVLRECLTDPEWGNAIPENLIDTVSWESAADTCYDEGLSFSFLWTRTSTLSAFMADVNEHIQSSVFLNRKTGLWEIKLFRKAVLTDVLMVSPENCISIELGKRSLNECVSEYTVKYTDNISNRSESITVQNPSLIARQKGIVAKEKSYEGISCAEVALIIANRDLDQLGRQIYSGTLEVSRDFEFLNRGDVFLLSYPEVFGTTPLICRISSLNIGTLQKEAISVSFYEDFYSYTVPTITEENKPLYIEETRWKPVNFTASPVTIRKYVEKSYYFYARTLGDSAAQTLAAKIPAYKTGYLVVGESPTNTSVDATITVNGKSTGKLDFSYSSTLKTPIDRLATVIELNSDKDIELLTVNSIAILGDELVFVEAINFPNVTIRRGLLDTIPVEHQTGTRFYGFEDYLGIDTTDYAIGETVPVKLLTNTPTQQLDPTDALLDTVTLSGRMYRPYRPANVLINNILWNPKRPKLLTVSFASRNRFLETTDSPIGFYEPSITSEANLTYTLEVYDGNTLVVSTTSTSLSITLNLSPYNFTTFGSLVLYSTNPIGVSSEKIYHSFTSAEFPQTFDSTATTFDSTLFTMDNI